MKIAVDANEANVRQRVGTGQYTYNILKHWSNTNKDDFHLYLKKNPLSDMPPHTTNWHYHKVGPEKMWLKFSLPLNLALRRHKFDVYFAPAHYAPTWLPSPLVVTIHDVAYEYFPNHFLGDDLYKLKNWTGQSVKRADKVIAVSENTKRDIIKYYNIDESKISVIHNGYDKTRFHEKVKPSPEILSKYEVPENNYILYVGTIQPRKNVLALVQAFHLLKKEGKYEGKLVIAGGKGWMAEETMKGIKESEYANDIILTGYVDSNDLPSLYKSADIYVLPSLYEGFGVPLIESMACGTPVAASDNSSLPEVVGDAGGLFDPHDSVNTAETILHVLNDKDKYIKRGLKQVKNFSWEKTANKTLEIITSAVR